MSATVAVQPARSPAAYVKPWDLWVLILPLLAMSPMLLIQWQRLMNRPERQFFPILVIVAFYFPLRHILSVAGQEERAVAKHRLWIALTILCGSIVAYLASIWGFSPWLAQLASLGVFCAWALGRCASLPWSSVAAWTGVLMVTVPLPFGQDEKFVNWLQSASASSCASALDALGVPNLRLANIIEIKGSQLFVEEACSGIGSMYALLAAAALLLLVNGRSLLCSVLVLVSVPVWAMLGNFMRLLTIALAQQYFQRDLSHGLDHELLGVLTFSFAAMGLWMTEWLVSGFLQPVPPASPEFMFVSQTFNALLCWPMQDPLSLIERFEDETEKEQTARLDHHRALLAAKEARVVRVQPWMEKYVRVLTRSLSGAALVAGVIPALIVSRNTSSDSLSFGLPEYSEADLARFPNPGTLPEMLGQWKQVHFGKEARSSASSQGAHSLIWEYQKADQHFLLSLDFPFRGSHPLELCYSGAGWKIENAMAVVDRSKQSWDWREISLENEYSLRGTVLYSTMTEELVPYENIADTEASQSAFSRIFSVLQSNKTTAALVFQPVCFQVQLVCESGRQLKDEELEDLRQQFFQARLMLRERLIALHQ